MRYTLWRFFMNQWKRQAPVVKEDLTGKTVVVLGANTGLGFETLKHFATMNPERLILACRSESKGEAAVERLKAETGYNAELSIVDLSDFSSVKQFIDRLERSGARLDILVENAATAPPDHEVSKDGWEVGLQVANLSTPLVALRLLPMMIKTAQEHSTVPRIVVVSSSTHYWADVKKQTWESDHIFQTLASREYSANNGMLRYPITKLLNVFFVRGLTEHLAPSSPVVVDAVCPGYCYSELRRNFSGIAALFDRLMELALAFPTEVGSRQIVYAALGAPANDFRGTFIADRQAQEVSDFVLSPQGVKAQGLLWDELVDILGKVDPKVPEIVQKYLSA